MSYQVIARKWRPQTFEDIVGQEHIVTTLKNSITSGRVHHAFLFTGIRGIGKTTAARVLAKALNCVNGPTPQPCNECEACREITEGRSLDVKEIDGASNRGIDSIRELREGVAFASTRDRYKVYIIDEVHMLTNEAFNALLKTLEEPPPHVVFIFATTELHKVPATIASRCQVFEFRRASLQVLARHLEHIAAGEGVTVEPDAMRLVAREADGSVRDGCSLLDQVISFAGNNIRVDDVAAVLRTGNRGIFENLLTAILAGDSATALKVFVQTQERGLPARQVLADLARFLSECIKVNVLGQQSALETGLTDAEIKQMVSLSSGRSVDYLAVLLNMLVDASDRAADSRSPELLAQAAVVQASRMDSLTGIENMISRLEDLMTGAGNLASKATSSNVSPAYVSNPAPRVAPPPQPKPSMGPAAQAAARLHAIAGVSVDTAPASHDVQQPQAPASPEPNQDLLERESKANRLILNDPVVNRLTELMPFEIVDTKLEG
ncbi:MAG TPA: DNA polymerase III subunit gamma/tau [Myxococcota bacterium]|nr:DNA polymerase III subunit gamma/tau [Myxococcota bacterium]HOS61870.1 DNA polymerase III subunit gamma/tau [Myxococcota bacterium]HPL24927.1 DNA polymerase III subunit gamma/tau [Myxococcota bacterium]HQE74274.1 DNA polymerase III subunit gamma/tau [Myxococcota bacterium]HQI62365.1 DNA polymerase III subunit gamma/tau [Myxococcota bacterium]